MWSSIAQEFISKVNLQQNPKVMFSFLTLFRLNAGPFSLCITFGYEVGITLCSTKARNRELLTSTQNTFVESQDGLLHPESSTSQQINMAAHSGDSKDGSTSLLLRVMR